MENSHLSNKFNLNENAAKFYRLPANQLTVVQTQILPARLNARDKLESLRIDLNDKRNSTFQGEAFTELFQSFAKNLAIRKVGHRKAIVQKNAPPLLFQSDRVWLEAFDNFVQTNLRDLGLSVPILAQTFAMSESSLYRQLIRLLGVSPVQYLMEKRLLKAQALLNHRMFKSVAQVAAQVGYSDTRSFSRRYYKRFGQLPSDVLKINLFFLE